jgi:hypothetical protein
LVLGRRSQSASRRAWVEVSATTSPSIAISRPVDRRGLRRIAASRSAMIGSVRRSSICR